MKLIRKMIHDIADFLPNYPDREDSNFNQAIFNKKEFYDIRLEKNEQRPAPGELLQAQKIVSRFLSPYTPYNELLINWDLGTGKTCAAIGAVETIKRESSNFKRALIFARGSTLLDNIKNEIVFRCAGDTYLPPNYSSLTQLEQKHRKNKLLGEFYSFNTFEVFAKNLSSMSDEGIIEEYSNTVIVIDEVHNIRLQDIQNKRERTAVRVYDNFHRFLHLVKNCKIILLSGTPVKDSVDEIASVMNLILPLDKQLPVNKVFLEMFFTFENNVFKVKPDRVAELKDVFKGRVSYLVSQQSSVVKTYIGESIGNLAHLKVVAENMSVFQSQAYAQAYMGDMSSKNRDTTITTGDIDATVILDYVPDIAGGTNTDDFTVKNFYSKSIQASLFVFPDGSYGSDGFTKFVKSSAGINTNVTTTQFRMVDELNKLLINPLTRMNVLQQYSSKYAATIKNIENAWGERSCFVYCDLVKGSGGILFSLLLEKFGYVQYTGTKPLSNKLDDKKRYAIINNESVTDSEVENIIKRFNMSSNMFGKQIAVIIGSQKISEGISLMNVQEAHILTPHWNYSETSQAIGRGYRYGSHADLINAGITPVYDIYQYVAIPETNNSNNINLSVDLKMYEMSEKKDISIRGIEQLIKVSAFDCALNYNRNHVTGCDNQRECNYTSCDYVCDDDPITYARYNARDVSSYQVYYNKENVKQIAVEVASIFRIIFRIHINELYSTYLKKYLYFDVITCLSEMINNKDIILNKYGFKSYLNEESGFYFLTSSMYGLHDKFSTFYCETPIVVSDTTFSAELDKLSTEKLPSIISKIFSYTTEEDITNRITKLPDELKEFIVEAVIKATRLNIEKAKEQRAIIMNIFKDFIWTAGDEQTILSLRYRDTGVLRCLDSNNEWRDCNESETDSFILATKDKTRSLRTQSYFGTYNGDKFCIVKSNISDDKRRENKGKVCLTWKKPVIVHLVTDVLKWSYKDFGVDDPEIDRARLLAQVSSSKNIKDFSSGDSEDYTVDYLTGLSDEQLYSKLYFSKMKLPELCGKMRSWFEKNNLLIYDANCGTSKKKTL